MKESFPKRVCEFLKSDSLSPSKYGDFLKTKSQFEIAKDWFSSFRSKLWISEWSNLQIGQFWCWFLVKFCWFEVVNVKKGTSLWRFEIRRRFPRPRMGTFWKKIQNSRLPKSSFWQFLETHGFQSGETSKDGHFDIVWSGFVDSRSWIWKKCSKTSMWSFEIQSRFPRPRMGSFCHKSEILRLPRPGFRRFLENYGSQYGSGVWKKCSQNVITFWKIVQFSPLKSDEFFFINIRFGGRQNVFLDNLWKIKYCFFVKYIMWGSFDTLGLVLLILALELGNKCCIFCGRSGEHWNLNLLAQGCAYCFTWELDKLWYPKIRWSIFWVMRCKTFGSGVHLPKGINMAPI